ncbi:TAXI family TRAP transporter solute-binding subunit [Mailhella massiliensis]|uniref:TAXI family TRAP transporter solute-binding subunit n=1 Tax=Mailhella massiliensis TaxID=1903261 RepID=UPI00097D615D|nr:TAXI family TRAP transporter solute-binding subunit [Mailhella massiliensis]
MLTRMLRTAACMVMTTALWMPGNSHAAEKYEICAGAFGSVTYQLSFAVSEILKQVAPRYELLPVETSGASASVIKGSARPDKMLMAYGALTFRMATQGKPPFPKAYPNLKVLGFATRNVQTLITYEPDIKSLADLKGRRIGMSVRPSVCGMDHWSIISKGIGDISNTTPSYMNWGSLQSALMDGTIDAAALGVSTNPSGPWTPLSIYAELVASKGVPYFLNIDEACIKTAARENGLPYIPVVIPRGAISENVPDRDVTAWEERIGIMAFTDMSEDLAYAITKILCENQEDIAKISPVGRNMSLEITVPDKNFLTDDQLHPGALRYYREKGLR